MFERITSVQFSVAKVSLRYGPTTLAAKAPSAAFTGYCLVLRNRDGRHPNF